MRSNKENIWQRLVGCSALFVVLYLSTNGQENIQYSQGKVEESMSNSLSIPLMSYKGRGIDLPVTLNYSSSVWRIDNLKTICAASPCSNYQTVTQAIYAEHSTAGWKSSLDLPKIEWPKIDDVYHSTGGTIIYYSGSGGTRIRRVTIHMPDGSSHDLRENDTPHTGAVDTNGTFYAVDGSRLRYDSTDADTGTLYMPDGTRYILDAGSGTMIDRHGNTLTYSASTRQWTDTLGRIIGMPIPANPIDTDYTYQLPGLDGVNGGLQTYTFKWRELDDVLVSGAGPARQMASHYLPQPASPPTDFGGNNYPLAQPTPSATPLFISEFADEAGYLTFVVGKGQVQGALFNPVVLHEIVLPDGSSYKFTYNVYGEVEKVVYPTGAYEQYQIAPLGGSYTLSVPYDQAERGVTSRKVSENGTGNDLVEWKYSRGGGGPTQGVFIYSAIAPDNTRTEISKMALSAPLHGPPFYREYWDFDFVDPRNGATAEKRFYSTSTDGLGGTLLRRELTEYERTVSQIYAYPNYVSVYRNIRPVRSTSILFEGSGSALAQTTTYSYDTTYQNTTGLDKTQENTYHFAVIDNTIAQTGTIAQISMGTLARYSTTTFQNSSNYQTRNILGLPLQNIVYDGIGSAKAKTEITYDTTQSLLTDVSSTRWLNPNTIYRGLPTLTMAWHDIGTNQFVETKAQYDQLGNLRNTWDGRNNLTQAVYSSTYDHAYPTSVITPVPDSSGVYGSNTAFTTTTIYDYDTGLPTKVTHPNGGETEMFYNDDLLRPTKMIAPNDAETITEYGEPDYYTGQLPASQRFVRVRSQIDSSRWKEALTWYDGLGRTIRTQSVDDDGDVFVLTCYDNMGRVSKASNPFRNWTNQQCSDNPSSLEWTFNTFDTAGRPWKVTTPDGAFVETIYSLAATNGYLLGTAVTVKDQALKERRSVTNAVGQLVRVDEPTTSGLGAITAPNQPTSYAYDTLNNLTTVTQGVQTRTFTYDAMSRLTSAINPESGTINYSYDANSNLATKTDVGRSISTTYTYDTLNRVTLRNYSESTPDVTSYYDNLTNAKGKLIKTTSSVSTTEYTAFDILGRVTRSKQTTDGVEYGGGSDPTKWMTYTYNLGGAMVEQQYPSGRVVKNVLDNSGDLEIVQSKKNAASGFWNYAENFTYNSAGALTSIQLGNGHWESTTFNNRLQPTQIALGLTPNTTELLKLNYGYGMTANNGNLLTQDITVKRSGQADLVFNQIYTYDELNRLKSAEEKTGTTTNWKQVYSFDRYGNRNFAAGTTFPTTLNAITNPSFNASNNRMNTGQGYAYDPAGNVTADANGQSYVYDAENKQTSASNGSGTIGQYYFDGDGKRVKKVVPSSGETTVFVYDAGGKLVAEYSTNILPTQDAKVAYVTNDNLGTPRINTDANGNVTSRTDYMPYGEEIIALGNRVSADKYVADDVRQGFTGYINDGETGLDFAQMRMYSNRLGRFTGPDPLLNSGRPTSPQTWNRYGYVLNNPIILIDPEGLYECTGNSTQCRELRTTLSNAKDRLKQIKNKNSKEYKMTKKALDTYGCESKGGNCVNAQGKEEKTAKGKPIKDTSGVVVDFNLTGDAAASTTIGTAGSTSINGKSIHISFQQDFSAKNAYLQGVVGNEGWDASTAQTHLRGGFGGTAYQGEYDSYFVQSVINTYVSISEGGTVYQGNINYPNGTNKKIDIWNKSWGTPDSRLARTNRDAAIKTILRDDKNYQLTPPKK